VSVYADLAAWLDGLGWPWFLFGGQAALVHGGTRVTADVDVTVVGDLASLGALEASVPQTFARRADRAFTERTLVLPVLHTSSGVPVDVVLGATRFEAEVASRAETTMIAATSMRVIAAEDLVVLKLLAGRPMTCWTPRLYAPRAPRSTRPRSAHASARSRRRWKTPRSCDASRNSGPTAHHAQRSSRSDRRASYARPRPGGAQPRSPRRPRRPRRPR
jgi:hypothetical protein